MRYLITTTDGDEPFLTRYYTYENYESHYAPERGMIVYDLVQGKYTTDGIEWKIIEEDEL